MFRQLFILLTIFLILAVPFAGCRHQVLEHHGPEFVTIPDAEHEPKRIVSTVPSVTEILFELGLGDHVVGVSRFCKIPEKVQNLPKVGGFFDPDYETLLALKPDLVILLEEGTAQEERLREFGIPYLKVNHRSIDGILDSFVQIGNRCGEQSAKKGRELQQSIRKRLDRIAENVAEKTKNHPKPRVLITLRDEGNADMQSVMIAGSSPFFQKAIELAGGVNAAERIKIGFPTVTKEEIVELNPDVVVGVTSKDAWGTKTPETFASDWSRFAPKINAVKNQKLIVISEDYAMIPGPRFILFVEKMANQF